jgi:uncharacterized protein (UPF0333 family)
MQEQKAQGSLEYLLMIGAAILVIAVVLLALSGIITDNDAKKGTTDYNSQMDYLNSLNRGKD